ncbi:MAG: hypothetical protein ACI8W8_001258 [Rhodothermales bacterium]|jgi:hypothetical protein
MGLHIPIGGVGTLFDRLPYPRALLVDIAGLSVQHNFDETVAETLVDPSELRRNDYLAGRIDKTPLPVLKGNPGEPLGEVVASLETRRDRKLSVFVDIAIEALDENAGEPLGEGIAQLEPRIDNNHPLRIHIARPAPLLEGEEFTTRAGGKMGRRGGPHQRTRAVNEAVSYRQSDIGNLLHDLAAQRLKADSGYSVAKLLGSVEPWLDDYGTFLVDVAPGIRELVSKRCQPLGKEACNSEPGFDYHTALRVDEAPEAPVLDGGEPVAERVRILEGRSNDELPVGVDEARLAFDFDGKQRRINRLSLWRNGQLSERSGWGQRRQ